MIVYNMGMRNKDAPHIDFGEFREVLGNRLPSNIDMVIERRGRFLIGEWKRLNEKVSKGQEILLKAMAKIPGFTVLVISGDTDTSMNVDCFYIVNKNGHCEFKGRGTQALKDYVQDWFLLADVP